jgi:hypothetical protein
MEVGMVVGEFVLLMVLGLVLKALLLLENQRILPIFVPLVNS